MVEITIGHGCYQWLWPGKANLFRIGGMNKVINEQQIYHMWLLAAPDQTRPDQTRPDQTRPDQTRPQKRHTTAIAFVPVAAAAVSGERSARPAWLCQPPPQGQPYNISLEVNRIKMWCCGPRSTNPCIPRARTTYPCAHGLLTMYLAGLVARDPNAFQTAWNEVNINS